VARSARNWSDIRSDIRTLLRETTGSTSFWSDAELLIYANTALDLRAYQLMDAHEGWLSERFTTDIVADQKEYTLPAGHDRVKRILLRFNEGSRSREIPLVRFERWSEPMYEGSSSTGVGSVSSYRLVGNLIYLEPPPTRNETNGLVIEMESLPDRLDEDTDTLDVRFPSFMETLLTYDTWDIALGVEDAQGNVDPQTRGRLQRFHQKLEGMFNDVTAIRSHGRVFSSP